MMAEQDPTHPGSLEPGKKAGQLPPGLRIVLEVIEGPDQGLKFEVTQPRTVLGRKKADLVLSDPTVSSRHAVLECVGSRLFITDLGSTNGTTLNGERIESAPCQNLDEIGLGDTKLLLSVVEDQYSVFLPAGEGGGEGLEDARLEDTGTAVISEPLPNPDLEEGIRVILDVIAGPAKGKKFQLRRRSTIIGRSQSADFQIDDPSVSHRHCQIEIHTKEKMTIKDLASANGTRLNDHYISAVKIRHGDVVQIGQTVIRILIYVRR